MLLISDAKVSIFAVGKHGKYGEHFFVCTLYLRAQAKQPHLPPCKKRNAPPTEAVEVQLFTFWGIFTCDGGGHGTSTWKEQSSLVFSTETAWAPCPKMMEELAAKFRLSLNFYSQEPGSIYYVRQSPDGVYTDTLHYESEEYGEDFYESLADFLKAHGAQYGLSADATLEETLAAVNATEDDRLDEIEDLAQAS